MRKIIFLIAFIGFLTPNLVFSQKGFQFLGDRTDEVQVSFQLINNLIVIPVEVNKKKLSFILDTGVNKTILFNLSQQDSLRLNNIEKIDLKGLGSGESVAALLSKNNQLKLETLFSSHEFIYVILEDKFDLSSKMGTTINGIIGYNLLKNFIVEINYKRKRLTFYNTKTYRYKKCRKCQTFPLQFYRKKPFIDVQIQLDTIGMKRTPLKMLIDSGGSDALWLFEYTKQNIKTPKRYFKDILGDGLSGTVYGNRSRVPEIWIGKFSMKNPTVSFLDTLSTVNARNFKQRNGSIGGNILKRFKVWIDYPNKKITLKKNGSFKSGFNYNMSGLDIVYDGKQLVREENKVFVNNPYAIENGRDDNFTIALATSYSYTFKPSYKINKVLPNSNAAKAGLLKDDILVKLNGDPIHKYTLGDIIGKFQTKDKKRIRLVVEREGQLLNFEFRLEKRI